MHGPINVKSPNNIRKWQMGFNSAYKWLKEKNIEKQKEYNLRYLLAKVRTT
jgi:fructose-1,6-bisphosphatase